MEKRGGEYHTLAPNNIEWQWCTVIVTRYMEWARTSYERWLALATVEAAKKKCNIVVLTSSTAPCDWNSVSFAYAIQLG